MSIKEVKVCNNAEPMIMFIFHFDILSKNFFRILFSIFLGKFLKSSVWQ